VTLDQLVQQHVDAERAERNRRDAQRNAEEDAARAQRRDAFRALLERFFSPALLAALGTEYDDAPTGVQLRLAYQQHEYRLFVRATVRNREDAPVWELTPPPNRGVQPSTHTPRIPYPDNDGSVDRWLLGALANMSASLHARAERADDAGEIIVIGVP
jgi:hypothetical protein